jgi:nitric oxide reductase activation protein
MNEEAFQRKLSELIAEIATLPASEREKLELLAEQTRERHRQLKETVTSLQESIDFVRLSIKYMLFDLEATRRENQQLRKMLDDSESSPS